MMGAVQNAGALAIPRAAAENIQSCIYKLARHVYRLVWPADRRHIAER